MYARDHGPGLKIAALNGDFCCYMKNPLVASLPGNGSPSTAQKVTALPSSEPGGTRLFASSEPFGWEGLRLEAGFRRGWQVDEIMVNGHHLTMNLAADDLCFETRGDSDWVTVRLAPLEFWINPEGRPFSVRKMADSRYASCTIDGRYLDSLAGCHFELDAGIGIADPVLARLVQALIAIIEDKAHYSQALAAEVIRAFVNAVAARHGHPAEELKAKGGIAPNQMKSLLVWLQDHIHGPLTVGLMATQVGLSAAHFSREFKRSTGLTPWDYVVRIRLDGAREALMNGGCSATVASQFGFSDQSHMARLFKLRFGVSPSAYVKANKAPPPDAKAG
jgi:AraC family transcriptional regulator